MAVQQNETNVITKLKRIIYSSMKFYEFQRSNNYGHFSGDLLYVDNVMVLDKLFLSFDPLKCIASLTQGFMQLTK